MSTVTLVGTWKDGAQEAARLLQRAGWRIDRYDADLNNVVRIRMRVDRGEIIDTVARDMSESSDAEYLLAVAKAGN